VSVFDGLAGFKALFERRSGSANLENDRDVEFRADVMPD
jgi:hypothetical protein